MARADFAVVLNYECTFPTAVLATAFESWLSDNTALSRGATAITRLDNIVTITVPQNDQSYDHAIPLTADARF